MSRERRALTLSAIVQLVACLPTWRAAGVRFPVRVFFTHHVYNGFGDCKLYFTFYLFSFIYFISSFIHIRE
jgi:hypothetical protein